MNIIRRIKVEKNIKVASVLSLVGGVLSILWTLFGLTWILLTSNLSSESDSILIFIWGIGAVFQFLFAAIGIFLSIRIKKKATVLHGIILLLIGILSIIIQFFISILYIIAGIFVIMAIKNRDKGINTA